jgi:hypothetical protein
MILLGMRGLQTISSGEQIRLIDLATSIYKAFLPQKKIHCDLPTSTQELFSQAFPKLKLSDDIPIHFRDTVEGITEDFRGRMQ